jgi:hypothetical protein
MKGVERAVVSAAVALLFLLQMFSIGVATGATANDASTLSAGLCERVEASTGESDGAPAKAQHVGPCCLLHCSSLIEAEVERAVAVVLSLEMFRAPAAPEYRIDAVIAAPELRPLSPRAPPARLV